MQLDDVTGLPLGSGYLEGESHHFRAYAAGDGRKVEIHVTRGRLRARLLRSEDWKVCTEGVIDLAEIQRLVTTASTAEAALVALGAG